MKKNILTFTAALIASVFTAFPASAATNADMAVAREIAAYSPRITLGDDSIRMNHAKDYETFYSVIAKAVGSVYEGCAVTDAGPVTYEYWHDGESFWFYCEGFSKLEEYQEAIDEWALSTAKELTAAAYDEAGNPTAMDKLSWIEAAYDYITGTYTYDTVAKEDNTIGLSEQGAYSLITTGKGICSGFSRAFVCLVEAVPFGEDGLVDWENGTDYIDAKVLDSYEYTHSIAGIGLNDGLGMRYFDLVNSSRSRYGVPVDEEGHSSREMDPDDKFAESLVIIG